MAGLLLTVRRYPLLDPNTFYWITLALFFVPILLLGASRFLKRIERDTGPLFALFYWCAVASIALCGSVLLNGALDRSAPTPIRARVLRKRISRGRSTVSYLVTVESWRSTRTEETLSVSRTQFQAVERDSSIGIDLHAGWLGLPWYGRISIR
jgi:hypothetical protein